MNRRSSVFALVIFMFCVSSAVWIFGEDRSLQPAPSTAAATLKEKSTTPAAAPAIPATTLAPVSTLQPTARPTVAFRYVAKNPQEQKAIDDYRSKIQTSRMRQCKRDETKRIDMNHALACLKQTTPSLTLEYPADAEEHFNEIREALAPWAQHAMHRPGGTAGYRGPWIENHWISHFEGLYDDSNHSEACLSDIFGPFIPLFVPWLDRWKRTPIHHPEGLIETLLSVLRTNVPYITVSQNDQGLTGKRDTLNMNAIPNVLVLSAGGYGHVPIPLLKQQENLNNQRGITNRTLGISYVGSLGHAPRDFRQEMHNRLIALNTSEFQYKYFYGEDWRKVMADSRFSLAPRGFGRTAFHLMESLQMGLVPIHVYSDMPWVPYADFYNEIGFMTDLNGVEALVRKLQNMTVHEIRERESHIVALRESHFSYAGVLAQIERFLMGQENDLRCQKLPDSVRDK